MEAKYAFGNFRTIPSECRCLIVSTSAEILVRSNTLCNCQRFVHVKVFGTSVTVAKVLWIISPLMVGLGKRKKNNGLCCKLITANHILVLYQSLRLRLCLFAHGASTLLSAPVLMLVASCLLFCVQVVQVVWATAVECKLFVAPAKQRFYLGFHPTGFQMQILPSTELKRAVLTLSSIIFVVSTGSLLAEPLLHLPFVWCRSVQALKSVSGNCVHWEMFHV